MMNEPVFVAKNLDDSRLESESQIKHGQLVFGEILNREAFT